MNFQGVFTAMVTPFKNGQIDYDSYENLIERQISGKVNGVVPCGTTGESPTLSHKEHEEFIERTVKMVKGRVKVIAGTGSNCTDEAVSLTQKAQKSGVDAVLLVNPYYNKPTQEGLYQHFARIADNTDLPCVLYNIPGRTGVNCSPEIIARLSLKKNIRAVKEATGDINQASQILELCGGRMALLSGDDSLTLPLISIGGKGVISVLSNIVPLEMSALTEAALDGESAKARDMHNDLFPLMRSMFLETNPIPVKKAMSMMGLLSGEIRLPLTVLSEANSEKLKEVLKQKGIL